MVDFLPRFQLLEILQSFVKVAPKHVPIVALERPYKARPQQCIDDALVVDCLIAKSELGHKFELHSGLVATMKSSLFLRTGRTMDDNHVLRGFEEVGLHYECDSARGLVGNEAFSLIADILARILNVRRILQL
jgi:hypothetical protein